MYTKKTGMLKIRCAKNTYGPKCQNTHGPKLWLLDTWAWAHGPGRMGRRRPAARARPTDSFRESKNPKGKPGWGTKAFCSFRQLGTLR